MVLQMHLQFVTVAQLSEKSRITNSTFWSSLRNKVFQFFFRAFEQVEPFLGQYETSDETYTLSKIDISGSNETKQKVLASIV